jgi:hypothetical protein
VYTPAPDWGRFPTTGVIVAPMFGHEQGWFTRTCISPKSALVVHLRPPSAAAVRPLTHQSDPTDTKREERTGRAGQSGQRASGSAGAGVSG